MRIGIYGGTFSPPHMGHIYAAAKAAEQMQLDRLFIVPAGMPPHKDLPEDTPAPEERFEMARLAFSRVKCACVSDVEIKRAGKSYTVDTVLHFKAEYPDAEIVLLLGTDMLLSFETWREYKRIMEEAVIATFSRLEGDRPKTEKFSQYLRDEYGAHVEVINNETVEISSTQLRDFLPLRAGLEYVDEAVYEYIVDKRLYGVKPDFAWLRDRAKEMLDPKRVAHVNGCERTAVYLARRWGVDCDEAREAAILHDITKRLPHAEQLLLCEKYGIMIDNVEKSEPKLLHAKTGAEIARDRFAVSEAVYGAIYWHTTGREDMTQLEKIIYLADYIEPTRHFDGLEELRDLSYSDLDAALLLGLKMSVEDLRERGKIPHERTLGAIAWLEKTRGNS